MEKVECNDDSIRCQLYDTLKLLLQFADLREHYSVQTKWVLTMFCIRILVQHCHRTLDWKIYRDHAGCISRRSPRFQRFLRIVKLWLVQSFSPASSCSADRCFYCQHSATQCSLSSSLSSLGKKTSCEMASRLSEAERIVERLQSWSRCGQMSCGHSQAGEAP